MPDRSSGERTRPSTLTVLLALAFCAGATDAFAYLALGEVFVANMTGNLVLVGLLPRTGYTGFLPSILVAVAGFVVAAFVGFSLARERRSALSPVGPLALLGTAALAQVAVTVGWVLGDGPSPGSPLAVTLVGLSAMAMGLQTVVTRRIGAGMGGMSTTFVTGMLTNLVRDVAERVPGHRTERLVAVLALVAGAVTGALVLSADRAWAPVPAVAATLVALVAALARHRTS